MRLTVWETERDPVLHLEDSMRSLTAEVVGFELSVSRPWVVRCQFMRKVNWIEEWPTLPKKHRQARDDLCILYRYPFPLSGSTYIDEVVGKSR